MSDSFERNVARLLSLQTACRKHPKLMKLVCAEVRELEHRTAGIQAAKVRQETFAEQTQQATRDIHALEFQAHELALRIRHAARMLLGPRDPRLVEFNVKPLRQAPLAAHPQET